MSNEMAESLKLWTRVRKDNESITDYSLAIQKLTVHANFPDLNHWLPDRFVTRLNRSHVAVQEKLSNMTNTTFERTVEIAVNMTMVKEHALHFHSSGGATVGASSSENVNRVRCAPKQTEGRYPRQVKRFLKQSQQATMLALWRQACATGTQVQIRKMLPIWQDRTYCEVKGLQMQMKGAFCD